MATMSAPDRTKANMAILPDTAANGSPSFPFHVCHRNGYFALDPAVEYTPTPAGVEIVFTPNRDCDVNSWAHMRNGCLAVVTGGANVLHISPTGSIFAFDQAYAAVDVVESDVKLVAGQTYKMVISTPDADTISVSVYSIAGGAVLGGGPAVRTSAAFFTGNPVITLGYLTKAQMLALVDNSTIPPTYTIPVDDFVIHSVARESTGPTAVQLQSEVFSSESVREVGEVVTNIWVHHPTQLRGFKISLADTYFKIINGNQLAIKQVPGAGYYSLAITAVDDFGKSLTPTITVQVLA